MVEQDVEVKTVKNTKLDNILEKVEELDKKIEDLKNVKKSSYTKPDNDTYKKRNVYVNKLSSKEIKQPKKDALEYYKVGYDEDTELYS